MRPPNRVLLVVTSAVLCGASPAASSSDSVDRQIFEILFGAEETSDARAADAIAALGDGAIRDVLEIYCGRREESWTQFADSKRAKDEPWPPAHFRPGDLVSRQENVFLLSLQKFPEPAVADAIAETFSEATIYELRIAFQVLKDVGEKASLETWIELAEEIEPIHLRREFVTRQLRESLSAMLDRSPAVSTAIGRRVDELDERLLPVVIRAAGETSRIEVINMLTSLLGKHAEFDPLILAQITSFATEHGLEERHTDWIRPFLDDRNWKVRRAAARTLAVAADFPSMGRIIELLDDEQPSVRTTAQWALERISGLGWASNRSDWQSYFEREAEWARTEGVRLTLDLRSSDTATLFAAVQELSSKPLFRHSFADDLARLLTDSRSEVVTTTCLALGRLGARRACPALVHLLLSPDEQVRNAAWNALRAISGKTYELDYDVWRFEFPS